MTVMQDPKTFCFNFDWLIGVDEFTIKSDESLAENKIKDKTEQVLSKFEHGNNIHEHRKQQNK